MADFRVELSLAHWLREMIVSDGGMLLNWIISQTIRNNVWNHHLVLYKCLGAWTLGCPCGNCYWEYRGTCLDNRPPPSSTHQRNLAPWQKPGRNHDHPRWFWAWYHGDSLRYDGKRRTWRDLGSFCGRGNTTTCDLEYDHLMIHEFNTRWVVTPCRSVGWFTGLIQVPRNRPTKHWS